MAGAVKVSAKFRGGRVKAPNLDQGPMTEIGNAMVKSVKARMMAGKNAYDQTAKPLSKKWAIIKTKKFGGRPKRDMVFTGETMKNFALRKAINNVIRAENSTRETRKRAGRAQMYEEMIAFSGTDTVTTIKEAQNQYGKWLQRAWVPIG